MLTVDRIAKVDSIIGTLLDTLYRAHSRLDAAHKALYRAIGRLGGKREALIVNAAYKAVEAKAGAIGKAEDKISDLEDDRAELVAHAIEARTILQRKYREALEALTRELEAKDDKINAGLAAAAEELVAATKAYDQTVASAYEKLGVEVGA